jgi:hypothetical protein
MSGGSVGRGGSGDPIVTANLDREVLARIDALAEERGLTRDEMILLLVLIGLDARERDPGRDDDDEGS